jgi:hypothetical protein
LPLAPAILSFLYKLFPADLRFCVNPSLESHHLCGDFIFKIINFPLNKAYAAVIIYAKDNMAGWVIN